MLNEQWRLEAEKEEQRKRERVLVNKERMLELIKHNALEDQVKETENAA